MVRACGEKSFAEYRHAAVKVTRRQRKLMFSIAPFNHVHPSASAHAHVRLFEMFESIEDSDASGKCARQRQRVFRHGKVAVRVSFQREFPRFTATVRAPAALPAVALFTPTSFQFCRRRDGACERDDVSASAIVHEPLFPPFVHRVDNRWQLPQVDAVFALYAPRALGALAARFASKQAWKVGLIFYGRAQRAPHARRQQRRRQIVRHIARHAADVAFRRRQEPPQRAAFAR